MFREVSRGKQQLRKEECIEILKNTKRGILSVIGEEDYPYGMPLNHYYNEGDHCLYFHSGKQGYRIECLRKNDKVSFCVMDEGYQNEGEWALNFQSVICFGRFEVVEDYEESMEIVRKLSAKFTDDTKLIEDDIQRTGRKTLVFRIRIEHMTGKKVNES